MFSRLFFLRAPRVSPSLRSRQGFTLIELLVVIAIIAILIGLLLPAVQKVREAAARMKCSNNLKQMGIALHSFHDSYNRFPPGGAGPTNFSGKTSLGGNLGWLVFILPYMEQQNLYSMANMAVNFDVAPNTNLNTVLVPSYQCPSATVVDSTNPVGKTTHYYGIIGPKGTNPQTGVDYTIVAGSGYGVLSTHGILGINTTTKMGDIIDGTSNTLMVGEISWKDANCYRPWTRGWDVNGASGTAKNVVNGINTTPYNGSNNFNDVSFGSQHTGGCNFALGDGSVRFIRDSITLNTYLSLASMNGGEVASAD